MSKSATNSNAIKPRGKKHAEDYVSTFAGTQLVLWFDCGKSSNPQPLGGTINLEFATILADFYRERRHNKLQLKIELQSDGSGESSKWLKIECNAPNRDFLHFMRKQLSQLSGVIDPYK